MMDRQHTEPRPFRGMNGCAVCGFVCAVGCCTCEHWQPEKGVELCSAVSCDGHIVDDCDWPVGLPHFDLYIEQNGVGDLQWGFVGSFLDDLVADRYAETVAEQDGYRRRHRIRECDNLNHSRSPRLNTEQLTLEQAKIVMAEIEEAQRVTGFPR